MRIMNCLVLFLLLFGLTACGKLLYSAVAYATRNPETPLPLHRMNVAEMFPGDRQAQALALAAADGDIERVNKLVARGANVNAVGFYGVTLPTWILYHPNKAGFKRLMELGSDPNINWNDGDTLLHWTTFMADKIGIEYLQMTLEIGKGNPNVERPSSGKRPIQNTFLLSTYRDDAFALLYNSGAEIDYKDKLDVPLVDHAVRSEEFDLAYFLLSQGVDFSSTNKLGGISSTLRVMVNYRSHGKRTHPDYMWFWRCVDFLEKQGMVFDFLPEDQRPAVLDTTPPSILSKLKLRQPAIPDTRSSE